MSLPRGRSLPLDRGPLVMGVVNVTPDSFYPLSRRRADAIRDMMLVAGVTQARSVGVGPAAAVACNLDPVTAALNQRVEVWVRRR